MSRSLKPIYQAVRKRGLYFATATGPAALDDLEIVRAQVQATAVPDGVTFHAQAPFARTFNFAYRAWVESEGGNTDATLAAQIATAIGKYMSSVPIGGFVSEKESPVGRFHIDGVTRAVKAAVPGLFHIEFETPATTDLASNQVATLGSCVAVSIVEAPQSVIELAA